MTDIQIMIILLSAALANPFLMALLYDSVGINVRVWKSGQSNVAWLSYFGLVSILILVLFSNLELFILSLTGIYRTPDTLPNFTVHLLLIVLVKFNGAVVLIYFSSGVRRGIRKMGDGLFKAYEAWCNFITGRK